MTSPRFRLGLGPMAVSLFLTLCAARALAGGWPFGTFLYQRGSPTAADAGYNLDDEHPGWYGGIRYREYYNYGRGTGFASPANYPGPLPNPLWAPRTSLFGGPPPHPVVVDRSALAAVPLPVYIEVMVPADAEVWVDGHKTTQAGPQRELVSPPLPPNVTYRYLIRARWREEGKQIEQAQPLVVKGGSRHKVRFPVVEELAVPREVPGNP
ncbi:MAG: TIGR03000 domain-containing protein [Gemmataceae bacterium]|nr:TIGR03000 domain-containing protein [Gemmataceae bacterium]MDW8265402.1 TIGR03000 domain-containing protein [Gemmataceae bacterium]